MANDGYIFFAVNKKLMYVYKGFFGLPSVRFDLIDLSLLSVLVLIFP